MSDELHKVLSLLASFSIVSILAVGGGSAVLPEMHNVVVDRTHWLTGDQFKEIYSLGQIAPGPNMTMVAVIGQHVAGWPGALAVLIGFFVPSSVLAFGANRLWHHFEPSPWLDAIQQAFAPVAIGLMAAGVWLLARLALEGTLTVTIAVISTAVLLARHVNPLYLIVGGALTKFLIG